MLNCLFKKSVFTKVRQNGRRSALKVNKAQTIIWYFSVDCLFLRRVDLREKYIMCLHASAWHKLF